MAKLYFYYAAMNAGKSTTLLQADFNYRERGMQTMLWTAALDERAGAGMIGSRIGLEADANRYSEDTNLFEAVVRELIKRKLDCILVDEAQFLSRDQVLQLCRISDELKISNPLLRPAHRFPRQPIPRVGGLAGPCRRAHRAEGGLRVRTQGYDEFARRC